MDADKKLRLEQEFFDREGLNDVIGALADICAMKAEWVEKNWQAPLNKDGRLQDGWMAIYSELILTQKKLRTQVSLLQGKMNNTIPEASLPLDGERVISWDIFQSWHFLQRDTITIFEGFKPAPKCRELLPNEKVGWQPIPETCVTFNIDSLWHLEGYGFTSLALKSNSFPNGADFRIDELMTKRPTIGKEVVA